MIFYSRKLKIPFDEAVRNVTQSLQRQGFGIITDIDFQEAFLKILKIGFRRYKILGACNPLFAFKAINLESHAGVMLPCNVVIQEHENGEIEISALNPLETMSTNQQTDEMKLLSKEVGIRLRAAVDFIGRQTRADLQQAIADEGNHNFQSFIPG